MRAALVIIFWLSLLAGYMLMSFHRAGAKWADFVEGFLFSFRLKERHPNWDSPGWRIGEIIGFIVWCLSVLAGAAVFVAVFVAAFAASFMWAGVI